MPLHKSWEERMSGAGKIAAILLLALACRDRAAACTTPVFRYALERWPSSPYVLEISGDREPGSVPTDAMQALQAAIRQGANLQIREVPSAEASPGAPLRIRLFPPAEYRSNRAIWEGALTTENVRKLVDSPARRQVIDRIQKGDAAVWVLLVRGDPAEDARLTRFLEEQLSALTRELKLPEEATDAEGKPLDIHVLNRGVRFSAVPVAQNDPEEEIFVRLLRDTEPDLLFYRQAMAFPVFGRGRAMYALVGKGIDAENLRTACASMIGWCSCTVKESNPGRDLLFMAEWEKIAGSSSWVSTEAPPPIAGLAGFFPGKTEIKSLPAPVAPPAAFSKPAPPRKEPAAGEPVPPAERPQEQKGKVVVMTGSASAPQGDAAPPQAASPRWTWTVLVTVLVGLLSVFVVSLLFHRKEK